MRQDGKMSQDDKMRQDDKTILIVTGGKVDIPFAAHYLEENHFDRIIAADAGLTACEKLGVVPTDIVGDFDSIKEKTLPEAYEKKGISVKTYPTKKDYTDTHLAVNLAMDFSPESVVILGGTGTRMDHTLANMGMLDHLAAAHVEGTLLDPNNAITLLCGEEERTFLPDPDKRYFSLFAWGGEAAGIDLTGFAYPLQNGSLLPSESLGISNELTADVGTVRVRKGKLLVIRARD